ncbi:MAG TPA: hypothetical protein VEB69_14175 [Acidimicrobiia bacterium]|nr:hypothetical protein [Acidimicrobiia bacterium]
MSESSSYVLFDIPDGRPPVDRDFLVRLGHPVEVCSGPGEGACPLVAGRGCPLAENAHGIVFELDLDRPAHRAVLRKYKTALDEVPIRIAVRPGQEEQFATLLQGIKVWTHEPVAGDLDAFAAEVEAADQFRDR